MRTPLVTLLCATAVATAGCGAVGHLSATAGKPASGKAAFVATCGVCHTLAAANTSGTIGPDLDAAFGPDRCQKIGSESTIRDVVYGQINYPNVNPEAGYPGMPANLVKGQTAKNVAAYVASVAGLTREQTKSSAPYWDCQTGAEVAAG